MNNLIKRPLCRRRKSSNLCESLFRAFSSTGSWRKWRWPVSTTWRLPETIVPGSVPGNVTPTRQQVPEFLLPLGTLSATGGFLYTWTVHRFRIFARQWGDERCVLQQWVIVSLNSDFASAFFWPTQSRLGRRVLLNYKYLLGSPVMNWVIES